MASDSAFVALLFDTWRLHNCGDDGQVGSAQRAGVLRSAEGADVPLRRERSVAVMLGGEAPPYRFGGRGPATEGLPAEFYSRAASGSGEDALGNCRRGWEEGRPAAAAAPAARQSVSSLMGGNETQPSQRGSTRGMQGQGLVFEGAGQRREHGWGVERR